MLQWSEVQDGIGMSDQYTVVKKKKNPQLSQSVLQKFDSWQGRFQGFLNWIKLNN